MRFMIFQRQVRSLLYKTYLQRKRSWGCTMCELVAPVVLATLLLVLPQWAGLSLDVETKLDHQPFPDPDHPFQSRYDIDVDPFMSSTNSWGLFRQLHSTDDGNSCWCKTLAIVGETDTADLFKSFMQTEYEYMKDYYFEARSQNMTMPDFVPGMNTNNKENWVQCPSNNTDPFFRIFESAAAVEAFVTDPKYGSVSADRSPDSTDPDRLCGAVLFPASTLSTSRPEVRLRFNVTWNQGAQYERFLTKINLYQDTRGLDKKVDWNSARRWYIAQGFVGVQLLIQRFLRLNHDSVKDSTDTGSFLDTSAEMVNWQLYPFPGFPYTQDSTLEFLTNFQFVLLFCFATTVALTIGRIVRERETRLREYMRMMGMYDLSYYVTWIIVLTITWALISLGVTGISFVYAFSASNFGLVFLFNFLFGLASMSFSFFISALCTRERLGSIIGFFIYFLCQAITAPEFSSTLRFNAASILPPSAYIMGVKTMFFLESTGVGVTAASLATPIYGYSILQAYYMLATDIVLWWILFYYTDQVNPFLLGYKRPWYFPVTPSYWRDVFGMNHYVDPAGPHADSTYETPVSSPRFQSVTDTALVAMEKDGKCIKTKNLKKKFGSDFYAVKGIDLTMYSDEIYCLLGHNGAGKTTTFSMLTGMLQPSAGSVTAFGMEIPRDMGELRRSMGVCPQHSALWEELTVIEHMEIFAGIRGLTMSEVRPTLNALVADVGLAGRAHFQVKALSGGMKRKLSVGIAFVGDPKIVFLDEPTSGMDPFARRSTWDLLKRKRSGRVICLTTHYMDEADVLGDRIAIMANGKLECSGTSMFLKKLYGCGYLLSFVKVSSEAQANTVVTNFIQSVVGAPVRVVSHIGKELIVEVKETDKFGSLLEQLDDPAMKRALGVESYGISVTNIEEVFLKVASNTHPGAIAAGAAGAAEAEAAIPEPPARVSFWQQFCALIERRWRCGLRDKQMFFMQIFLPFIILLATLGFLLAAVNRVAYPLTLGVAPLNPELAHANSVQQSLAGDADVQSVWTDYCAGTTLSSTECDALVAPVDGVSTLYDFQQVLVRNSTYFPGAVPWTARGQAMFGYSVLPDPNAPLVNRLGVWHNATGLHTASLGTLGQFNAWASRAGDVQMKVVNDPFPETVWEKQQRDFITGASATQMIILAMSFLPTAVVSFIVMEKEREVKSQLFISGVSPRAYWISHFVFDSIASVLSALVAIIVFAIYNIQLLTGGDALTGSFALLLLYGPASSAMAYVVSYVFNRQFAAQSFIAVMSIILGNLLVVLAYVLKSIPTDSCSSCSDIGQIIQWAGRVFPPFILGSGFYRLTLYVSPLGVPLTSSDMFGGCRIGVVWGNLGCYSGIGDDLFFMGVMTGVYLLLAVLIDEIGSIPWMRNRFVIKDDEIGNDATALEDDDVIAEKQRVDKLDKKSQMLYVGRVRKLFRRVGTRFAAFRARMTGNKEALKATTVYAVESVSFAADKGQVFGLLGVNGAGKTTTFKMLCGLYCPSGGSIYVLGMDASTHMKKVRRHVGYCPQFDALWDLLTTREHVLLYAKIRGYTGADLEKVVAGKLRELDLLQYTKARAGTLSGGNKRKLSVAMALVGEPELVFLDEPSCGMDPFARRSMWNIIESVAEKRKHSLIILTTHSMEEAEALCSRVAIQVDGRFRCLGSCQEIKNRYGEGFELTIRAKPSASLPPSANDIVKSWGQADVAKATGTFLTQENAVEVVATEAGREARFSHKTYGPKRGPDGSLVEMIELATWINRDGIFGRVVDFLIAEFGPDEFEVIELHGLSIKVKVRKLEVSKLFRKLEAMKESVGIDDFQISQTSLEQIFNKFAATAANRED